LAVFIVFNAGNKKPSGQMKTIKIYQRLKLFSQSSSGRRAQPWHEFFRTGSYADFVISTADAPVFVFAFTAHRTP
jgi:hypothetical protein